MRKIEDDRILAYIESQLEKDAGPKEIAEAFGYSPEHFRHLFRTYYDIPLGNYLRRRRLLKAARQIQNGKTASTEAALIYGFETAAGFSKAFRREFGFSASELKNQGQLLEDLIPDPVYDKSQIKISYVITPELRIIGKTLPSEEVRDFDRLEECAYWLDHRFPQFTAEEMKRIGAYKNDVIAMWYHTGADQTITYLAGPVVKSIADVPEGTVAVTLPGRRYAGI